MKKIVFILFLGFNFTMIYAQDLFVSTGSYIYVKDEVVFVNDDIQLDFDSNIYLRKGAQLLQNTNTSIAKNSDEGELSVYQVPTTNIFGYNYWASPVGVGIGNTGKGDVPFDYTNMHKPASIADNEISSPQYGATTAYDATASAIATYWLWSGINVNHYNDWVHVAQNTNAVPAGQGFTMKGRLGLGIVLKDEQIDFRGRPNTGEFKVECKWVTADGISQDWQSTTAAGGLPSGNGLYVASLIGNPYPSTMDLKLLFVDATGAINRNTFLDGKIYFWQEGNSASHLLVQYEGGYSTWVPGDLADMSDHGTFAAATFKKYDGNGGVVDPNTGNSGTNYPSSFNRRYAAIAQGFFVRTEDALNAATVSVGGDVTIDNSMRVYIPINQPTAVDVFERSASTEEAQEYRAMSHNGVDYNNVLNNPTIIPEITIASDINDSFYRISKIAFREGVDVNSYTKYVDATTSGGFTTDTYFAIENLNLLIKSLEYSEDVRVPFGIIAGKETNNVFDIKVSDLSNVAASVNIYMYDKITSIYTDIKNGSFSITLDKGVYNDRFEITFNNQALLSIDDDFASQLQLFQNNGQSEITILNPNSLDIKDFKLYDINGRLILSKSKLELKNKYTFNTSNLSSGVYIANIKLAESDALISKKVLINNN